MNGTAWKEGQAVGDLYAIFTRNLKVDSIWRQRGTCESKSDRDFYINSLTGNPHTDVRVVTYRGDSSSESLHYPKEEALLEEVKRP